MDFRLTDDQQQLRLRARDFADRVARPRAAEIDRTESYPRETALALVRDGFAGMTLPPSLGGGGRSLVDTVLVVEEIARACAVTARIVVETNVGAIGAIIRYGTEHQKALAARLVLEGDKPAICITEPEAGSAASEMTTRADRRSDRYVLKGRKHWITGGGVSRLYLIFARVFDEGGRELGIGAFLVVSDAAPKGLVVGKREPTMGLRGIPETEIVLDGLEVHHDMVLVPPRGLAHGFADLMNAYNAQRVGAAAVALGLAAGAFDLALDYSTTRYQFGRPICEFQGLQWMLADMSIAIEAARHLVYRAAASSPPGGFPDPLAAAQAKVLAAETAIRVTGDALQIFGAAGYSRDRPLERMARDARMFTIGGGTSQILRTLVASKLLGRRLPQTREGYLREP